MKIKYFKIIFYSFIGMILFISMALYTKTNSPINFKNIILNDNKIIDEKTFFKYIEYNKDSTDYYSEIDINLFIKKIKSMKEIGIIEDIRISYSIPNDILVNIISKNPTYFIKTKSQEFVIDDKGQIFDKIFSENLFLPTISVRYLNQNNFLKWDFENEVKIKKLFKGINHYKENEKYLLDTFQILKWFSSNYLYSHVDEIVITEKFINVILDDTKIYFSKSMNDIKTEINKINQIVKNEELFDSLSITNLTDLKEIKLCFKNQIIIKS